MVILTAETGINFTDSNAFNQELSYRELYHLGLLQILFGFILMFLIIFSFIIIFFYEQKS